MNPSDPSFRMLCVDPGLRGCGVAIFDGARLTTAGYVKNPSAGRGYSAASALARAIQHRVVTYHYDIALVEYPRAYGSVHAKGDPNDLLDVAAVGSAVAMLFEPEKIESVFPSDWKGNVKKSIMLVRIAEKLTDEERAVVQKTNKSDTEDILDAIGIGLWKLRRLNARRFANE